MATSTATTRDLNDTVIVVWVVRDPANGNQPVDPVTSVTFKVKDPNGNITTSVYGAGVVQRPDIGTFFLAIPLNLAGTWAVNVEGIDGLYTTADEVLIPVQASVVV